MSDIFFEIIFILFLVLSGANVLVAANMKINSWLIPLGFIAGMGQFIAINLIQIVSPFTSSSALTFILIICISLYLLKRWSYNKWISVDPKTLRIMIVLLISIAGLVAVLNTVNLLKFHYDSYLYLITGRYIFTDNLDELSKLFLTKRFGSTAIIHSLAEAKDLLYFRSITPISSLATISLLFYFPYKVLKDRSAKIFKNNKLEILLVCLLGAIALITSSSYDFHSFYINGHMFFAMFLLCFVGAGWVVASKAADWPQRNAFALMQALSMSAAVFTRPEGGIIMAATLFPFLLGNNISSAHKRLLLVTFGASMLVERLILITSPHFGIASLLSFQQAAFAGLGVASIVLAIFINKLPLGLIDRHKGKLLLASEAGLWALIVAYMFRSERSYENIVKSLNSFYYNFFAGEGAWSYLIVMLAVITLIALFKKDTAQRVYIRYAVTTFLPLSLLIGIFRGAGYRVGNGDSFNRAIMHILPTVVLLAIVTILSKSNTKNIKN